MQTIEVDARRIHAAKNQALFREVNERIKELNGSKPSFAEQNGGRTAEFICECASDECTERITLALARYEEIRSDPNTFFVATGHEIPLVEDVVGGGDGYVVVRKIGAGMQTATALDPRRRER